MRQKWTNTITLLKSRIFIIISFLLKREQLCFVYALLNKIRWNSKTRSSQNSSLRSKWFLHVNVRSSFGRRHVAHLWSLTGLTWKCKQRNFLNVSLPKRKTAVNLANMRVNIQYFRFYNQVLTLMFIFLWV